MPKGIRIFNGGVLDTSSFDYLLLKTIAEKVGKQLNQRIMFTRNGDTIYGTLRMIEVDCQEDLLSSKLFLFIEEKSKTRPIVRRNWHNALDIKLYSGPAIDILDFHKRIAPEVFKKWKI